MRVSTSFVCGAAILLVVGDDLLERFVDRHAADLRRDREALGDSALPQPQ